MIYPACDLLSTWVLTEVEHGKWSFSEQNGVADRYL